MPAKFAYVDGTAVHYLHAGSTTLPGVVPDLDRGELIVFLHDAGGNAGIWRSVTSILDRDHSTINFDFPGHGRSGGTESLMSVDAHVTFFGALVETLGLRPAVLVGHGLGATIAIRAALRWPQTVRSLILVGAACPPDVTPHTLETWSQVMRGRAPQPFTTEAFSPKTDFAVMREGWTQQVKTDPRVRYFDLAAWGKDDATDDLAKIEAPTLVVVGDDDQIAPLDRARRLQHGIRGAKLVTVADAGHLAPLEKPTEVAAAIADFLSDPAGKSGRSERSDTSP